MAPICIEKEIHRFFTRCFPKKLNKDDLLMIAGMICNLSSDGSDDEKMIHTLHRSFSDCVDYCAFVQLRTYIVLLKKALFPTHDVDSVVTHFSHLRTSYILRFSVRNGSFLVFDSTSPISQHPGKIMFEEVFDNADEKSAVPLQVRDGEPVLEEVKDQDQDQDNEDQDQDNEDQGAPILDEPDPYEDEDPSVCKKTHFYSSLILLYSSDDQCLFDLDNHFGLFDLV